MSPAGRLYIATQDAVYRLDDDGTLAVVYRAHGEQAPVTGIAVDKDERLYLAVAEADQVYRVTAGGERTTIAELSYPAYVAVDSGGNVYVATSDGIRRVDENGTITKVASVEGVGPLVLDRHGDLYYVDNHSRVKVLVQPGQLAGPFPWGTVIWVAVGTLAALALGTIGWFGPRLWNYRNNPPVPAPVDGESTPAPAPDPTDEPAD